MKLSDKNVIFIQGSTAIGKSNLALSLAQKLNGVIVNCDSIQCYKGLYIGSAQPLLEDKQLVPHFLYDFVDVNQDITAGIFRKNFFEALKQIKNKYVFVVGGTGFYFQAIEKGMYPVDPSDEGLIFKLENQIKLEGSEKLWIELFDKDPETAKKISKNDHFRLMRAIEIVRTKGSISDLKKKFKENAEPFPYKLLKIGLLRSKREMLDAVSVRTKKMLRLGLVDEVKQILETANKTWAPLQSVGYREVMGCLSGQLNVGELEPQINLSTLKLIKKQITWFKRDYDINWFCPDERLNLSVLQLSKIYDLILNMSSGDDTASK
jgi:tRNA dimethylallyltransferase